MCEKMCAYCIFCMQVYRNMFWIYRTVIDKHHLDDKQMDYINKFLINYTWSNNSRPIAHYSV